MTRPDIPPTAAEAARYRAERQGHWDRVAAAGLGARAVYYHRRLAEIYRLLVPEGARVLEVGSGTGDLLAALKPREGIGIDFSPEVVARARRKHPGLTFHEADAHDFDLTGHTFDYVLLSDLLNDVWDVQRVLARVAAHCGPTTRVVLNSFSHLWAGPLGAVRRLGLATPVMPQNWLSRPDIVNLLHLAGFEVVRKLEDVVFPVGIPVLSNLANEVLAKVWPFRLLALTQVLVARPTPVPFAEAPSVTVVIPARNEAGNIPALVRRTPEFAGGTQIVFVEGGSSDDTWGAIERELAAHPERNAILLKQTGKGKGDAVRVGFAAATGDLLMILDADVSVLPEDLLRFYDVYRSGRGEFVNGVRLVYPMQDQAMRFFNLLGNKFFSYAFSWLLGQPVKDTLCGTKVLSREAYERVAANRRYFGDFDPFGDFDLIFGAAKLNLRIVDLPVRYHARTYGETNIQRWRHGWLLLRMVLFAARKIKFV